MTYIGRQANISLKCLLWGHFYFRGRSFGLTLIMVPWPAESKIALSTLHIKLAQKTVSSSRLLIWHCLEHDIG